MASAVLYIPPAQFGRVVEQVTTLATVATAVITPDVQPGAVVAHTMAVDTVAAADLNVPAAQFASLEPQTTRDDTVAAETK